jgi:catechol 2,3-dioxygenase-like lactoylglutathione lyase family enzyme
MKRFHVHVRVADLETSIGFYSRLFGAQPSREEQDYAKWMLDDPRINFAISTRGEGIGIDHLGFQTDDSGELAELRWRAEAADMAVLQQGEVACCYSRSEKHWVTDPQGIAWEHFHTLADVPVYGSGRKSDSEAACCAAPSAAAAPGCETKQPKSACC